LLSNKAELAKARLNESDIHSVLQGGQSIRHLNGTGGWQVANGAGGANVNRLMSSAPEDLEKLAGMARLTGVPVRVTSSARSGER